MSDTDTDFIFKVMPSYNEGELRLLRTNAPIPEVSFAPSEPPQELYHWLHARGWVGAANGLSHPKVIANGFQRGYTWDQAMAIEFFNFVNLGIER